MSAFPTCRYAGADRQERRLRRGRPAGKADRYCNEPTFGKGSLKTPEQCHACPFAGTVGESNRYVPAIPCNGCGASQSNPTKNQGQCVHLGEAARLAPCSCKDAIGVQVYQCEVHGECVLTADERAKLTRADVELARRKACEKCPDHLPQTG